VTTQCVQSVEPVVSGMKPFLPFELSVIEKDRSKDAVGDCAECIYVVLRKLI